MIPNHCIEKFKKTFNQEPSIISIEINDTDKFDLMTKKSMVLWFNSLLNGDKIECLEKLVEYDVSGIYIYYSKINDSEKIRIDFLLTIDRQNLTEFTIKKLINLKNNGN
jgi:hypothetical protein